MLNNAQHMAYYVYVKSLKSFFTSLILLTLVGIVLWTLAPRILSEQLRPLIEEKITKETGAFVILDSVEVSSLYPFYLKLNKLEITNGALRLKIPELELKSVLSKREKQQFYNLIWQSFIDVKGFSLNFDFENVVKKKPPKSTNKEMFLVSVAEFFGWDSSLHIRLSNGRSQFEIKEKKLLNLNFNNIEMQAEQTSLLKGDSMRVDLDTNLNFQTPFWSAQLPLKLQSENINLSFQKMVSEDAFLILPGLAGRMKFLFDSKLQKQNVSVSFAVKDFAQVKLPPQLKKYGSWSGGLSGNMVYSRVESDYSLQGHLVTNGLTLNGDYKGDDIQLKGNVFLNSNINFFTENQQLVLNPLQMSFDASQAETNYLDVIQKGRTVPLRLSLIARTKGSRLVFSEMNTQLGDIKLQMHGELGLNGGDQSFINFKIPTSNLNNLYKLGTVFNNRQWQGNVAGEASFAGDLTDKSTWTLAVNRFQLGNVAGYINYKSQKNNFSLNGPIFINSKSNFNFSTNELSEMNMDFQADLTHARISKTDWVKPFKSPFNLDLKLIKEGEKLIFKKGQVNYSTAKFNVLGSISEFVKPKFNIRFLLEKFPISHLQRFFKKNYWNVKGGFGFSGRLKGHYNSIDGVTGSPLVLTGKTQFAIEELSKNANIPITNIESLLPNWKVFANSQIQVKALLKKINFAGINFSQGIFNGSLDKGILGGKVSKLSMENNGSLIIEDFKVNLLNERPFYNITGKYIFLPVKVIEGLMQLNDEIKLWGTVSGSFVADIPVYSGVDLNLESKFKWDNGFVSTFKIDSLVNEKLKIMKKVSFSRGKEKGHVFRAEGGLLLNNDVLELFDVQMLTAFKDRFMFSGTISKDLQANIKGFAFLANPPVRPEIFEANMNKQAQLEIPFYIFGTLLKPKASISDGLEDKLLYNYSKKKQ